MPHLATIGHTMQRPAKQQDLVPSMLLAPYKLMQELVDRAGNLKQLCFIQNQKNIQDSPFSSMGWGQLATASLKLSLPKHARSKPGSHLEPGWDFAPVRHLSNQVLDLLQQVLIFNLESWDVTGRPGHKRSLKFNCTNTTKYKVQCKQH